MICRFTNYQTVIPDLNWRKILKMKDCLFSSIGDTSRIVQDSGELTKAWLKYAADKVFQNDGHQRYWAEVLHQR